MELVGGGNAGKVAVEEGDLVPARLKKEPLTLLVEVFMCWGYRWGVAMGLEALVIVYCKASTLLGACTTFTEPGGISSKLWSFSRD